MLGYEPSEFEGNIKTWEKLLHPDDKEITTNALNEHFENKTPIYETEHRLKQKSGEYLWILDRGKVISRDREGKPLRMTGCHTDISERKILEEQLRKLAQAVEQSSESIVITDHDAKIEYVNQAFIDHTGFSREEAIGANPRTQNSGKTPPETYVAMWDALTHGRTWKGVFYNKKKDGTPYTEFAVISPIRQENGTITHYVAVKEDITEKEKLGKELDDHRNHLEKLVKERTVDLTEARDIAETANRAKSKFLSTMSHELRTPLNAVLGFGDLLKGQHFGELNPKQGEHVDHILSSGKHLLALINDILNIAKIDSGAETVDVEAVSIEEYFTNAVAVMSSQFDKKHIKVTTDIASAATMIDGDQKKLKQIMLNLLSNALKYTPEKGRVDIRAKKNKDYVRISVTDNGIGIDKKDHKVLFDEFMQVDRKRDENLGGTGIGLALTRKLVELHGGEIGVDSELGKGSTFWFTIPDKNLLNVT
jgi:two-component system sensor histidine kinase/response regulator